MRYEIYYNEVDIGHCARYLGVGNRVLRLLVVRLLYYLKADTRWLWTDRRRLWSGVAAGRR
jgi:uncharacterized iron-regulated membrane protein